MATGDAYNDRGVTKWLALTSAPSSLSAPTAAELDAGTDLSPDIAAVNGFERDVSFGTSPSLATTTDFQSVDSASYPASGFDLYRREASTTIYDIFDEGTDLWLVACIEGRGTGNPTQVWPVDVANRTDLHGRFGQRRQYRVQCAIKADPTEGTEAA